MTIRGEVIWITGASSGLGAALAQQLAQQGNRVILSARDADKLQEIARTLPGSAVLPFDIGATDQVDSTRLQLTALTERIDRVILNAGTCEYLDIDTPDWQMMPRLMATNYAGLINSLAAAFDLLKRAARPHIVGIGSLAIRAPFPRAEAYGASKAAVGYFLEALRIDVARFNIDVTHVLPGFIDTPLTRRNDFPMPFILSAEKAAARIIAALEQRPYEYAFPRRLSAVLWLARRCPRLWQRLLQNNSTSSSKAHAEFRD